MKRILVVAGEASADRYGARLVEKLRELHPDEAMEFFGAGGDQMERAGAWLLCHNRELASIGPREALAHFRAYFKAFRAIVQSCAQSPPVVAVLMDFPEFNLRLAKKLKRMGIKVIYYIGPQLWAWRSGRIKTVQACVDRMLVILPFEEDYYRRRGVDVEFVGHPLLEDSQPAADREEFLKRLNLDPRRKTVALLPGSRSKEIHYILPTLIQACLRVLRRVPTQFLISVAPSVSFETVHQISSDTLRGNANALYFRVVSADARKLLANSDFGFVKSGTSTLEAALVGTPFLIVYKISNVSWYVGNILIRSPFKGLVNLIANEQIVPEYMQGDATPDALAGAALECLERPERAAAIRKRLSIVREALGARPATETVARVVERYL